MKILHDQFKKFVFKDKLSLYLIDFSELDFKLG